MAYANLHLHTYFSDGLISPSDLAKHIFNKDGLEYFALTDHDTMSGIEPFFRSIKRLTSANNHHLKRFIPGIELSLQDEPTGLYVHVIGLFPHITERNYRETLGYVDSVLGEFCRYRGENRAIRDLDEKVRQAYKMNLDGVADRFGSAETVISILREKADQKSNIRFQEDEKQDDVIQHPIPTTYQTIIDHWKELLPSSTREKIMLYLMRPARTKMEQLAQIYMAEGMGATDAMQFAWKNQGVLVGVKTPALKELGLLQGLALLQKAKAITILAHPAVDHHKIGYDDFDHNILMRLIENGLDGIEVYYPYDATYRSEAFQRYYHVAMRHGLLISGGTDFHGDSRVGLADVRLDVNHALRIMNYREGI